MDQTRKLELMTATLERAADVLGDLTDPAMALYYERLPAAREAFERHALGDQARLEGGMVENTLYCLMTWLESRAEVQILLWHSVPHHEQTLRVPAVLFTGMVEAVADVVAGTIPADAADELQVWREIANGLVGTILEIAAEEARLAA